MHMYLFSIHWIQLFLTLLVTVLDQYTETSSAVHSKQMVGMSSKEEETEPLPPATGNG